MRQLQLFTTAELARMRDRTASRNHSPARSEFRRVHEGRRAWGLARRHAERLRHARRTSRAAWPASMDNGRHDWTPDPSRPPSRERTTRPALTGNPRPAGLPRDVPPATTDNPNQVARTNQVAGADQVAGPIRWQGAARRPRPVAAIIPINSKQLPTASRRSRTDAGRASARRPDEERERHPAVSGRPVRRCRYHVDGRIRSPPRHHFRVCDKSLPGPPRRTNSHRPAGR